MTREEAIIQTKERYKYGITTESDTLKLIDAIYDDFESRKCKNCKYFNEVSSCEHEKNTQYLTTSIQFDEQTYYQMDTTKDFGCNRFEGE